MHGGARLNTEGKKQKNGELRDFSCLKLPHAPLSSRPVTQPGACLGGEREKSRARLRIRLCKGLEKAEFQPREVRAALPSTALPSPELLGESRAPRGPPWVTLSSGEMKEEPKLRVWPPGNGRVWPPSHAEGSGEVWGSLGLRSDLSELRAHLGHGILGPGSLSGQIPVCFFL